MYIQTRNLILKTLNNLNLHTLFPKILLLLFLLSMYSFINSLTIGVVHLPTVSNVLVDKSCSLEDKFDSSASEQKQAERCSSVIFNSELGATKPSSNDPSSYEQQVPRRTTTYRFSTVGCLTIGWNRFYQVLPVLNQVSYKQKKNFFGLFFFSK